MAQWRWLAVYVPVCCMCMVPTTDDPVMVEWHVPMGQPEQRRALPSCGLIRRQVCAMVSAHKGRSRLASAMSKLWDDALPSRSHLPSRSDRQFQHLAERGQICSPWPTVISLPEIYAGLADTDLFSNFRDR
jgi:hypothetical protein